MTTAQTTIPATMTRWFSLRRRLLVLLLGGVTLFWAVTLVLSYLDAHHEVDELLDAQLMQTAQTLLALAQHENRRDGHESDDDHDVSDALDVAETPPDMRKYQRRLRFQLWRHDGRLLLRSPNAPATPLADIDGFSDHVEPDHHRRQWRTYSQWDAERRFQVQVAEDHHVRNELIGKIAMRLLLPALFGLPLLGAWLWLATRRGLAPLDAAAKEIAARKPGQLNALMPSSAPTEIRPLIEALNALFARVEQALENERSFTANAAHELRTPLAALAAQAQVAERATDAGERAHAIGQLRNGIERAAHLVDQLLTLARLDPGRPLADRQSVALRTLAEDVCAAHGAAAVAKGIELELAAADVTLTGSPTLLGILLRNLLDNALRYTPAGGHVQMKLSEDTAATGVLLQVVDDGPGIPADEREQVFHRFHRLAGQDQSGSGLGLSIVRRIVELHHGAITLDETRGGGLTVSVRFGTDAAATKNDQPSLP